MFVLFPFFFLFAGISARGRSSRPSPRWQSVANHHVLVTHVTLMMDGDPPSISLVFRRPVGEKSIVSRLAFRQRALQLASQPATVRRHTRPPSSNPARKFFLRICPSPQHAHFYKANFYEWRRTGFPQRRAAARRSPTCCCADSHRRHRGQVLQSAESEIGHADIHDEFARLWRELRNIRERGSPFSPLPWTVSGQG